MISLKNMLINENEKMFIFKNVLLKIDVINIIFYANIDM